MNAWHSKTIFTVPEKIQFLQIRKLTKWEEDLFAAKKGETMIRITLSLEGYPVDFVLARKIAETIALQENPETALVAWSDAERGMHSPQGVRCEIHGKAGWEVYGCNHGGRLRISFDRDRLVFIYS